MPNIYFFVIFLYGYYFPEKDINKIRYKKKNPHHCITNSGGSTKFEN